jgi:DNA-binding transcriptional ArsR family regulator
MLGEVLMDQRVKNSIKDCNKIIPFLKVVSNTTRLKILCILNEGERRVGEIQEFLGAKQSYVSQQLKYLKNAGYLANRREGTQIYYRLINQKFSKILLALKDTFCK